MSRWPVAAALAQASGILYLSGSTPLSTYSPALAPPPDSLLSPDAGVEERPLRRHLGIITLSWIFGAVWMTAISGSPVTQFMKGLGASNFQFGLFAALPFIASLVSVPASLLIERTGRRKGMFLFWLYLQRLLWFPIALVPLWIISHGGKATTAMTAFMVLALVMHACGAMGGPAWVSWMADAVPMRLRSRYFARRRQWGIPLAIVSALVVGWVLDRYAATPRDPHLALRWCAIIFMAAAVFGVADIHLFHYVPETPKPPKRGGGLLRAMAEPLRDRRFLFFGGFVATLTFAVSFTGQFVTLYLHQKVYVGDKSASFGTGTQLMLLVMPMMAQLLVLSAWGTAADRMGKKPLLVLAALGLVPVGLGWSLLGPGNIWLGYLLSAAGAALWTGVEVANFNLVIEMSGSEKNGAKGGSAYVAVNSVIVNVAGCLGGLASGLIAQSLKDWSWQPAWAFKAFTFYDALFILSGLLRLGAVVVFLPFIQEPAASPAREALRFMSANIYNNVFNAVLQPIRYLRASRAESFTRD